MKISLNLTLIISKLTTLWKQLNIQTLVLTSFAFQLVLILVAPFRKRTSNAVITASIWLSYLLADWVAAQAIGLISKALDTSCGPKTASSDTALFTFWAQFLLLHLGGPDTITALALEDNELWLRTGLHLSVQAYFTFGILLDSVQRRHSRLWAPTVLILLAGVIKYLERILSLFHGRLSNYSEEESDYYAKQLKEYDRSWDAAVRSLVRGSASESDRSQLTEIHMVRHAFYLFQYYKRVYDNQEFSFNEREQSRLYFSKRTPQEAFRVLEIQFNFTYEAFYTKMVIIQKTIWKVLRYFVMLLEVACLVIWFFFTEKHGFRGYEIRITHTLLIGAISVELFAFIRIQLSNWTIAEVKKDSKLKILLYNRLLSARKRTWGRNWRVFFRWWSESVSQLSLINLYMDDRNKNVQKAVEFLGVKEVLDRRKYVTQKWFSDHMRDFIFEDLKKKAKTRGGIDNICNVKGGWACLRLITVFEPEIVVPNVRRLMDIRREYEIILLRWHIITELCYRDEIKIDDEDAEENVLKRLIRKFKGKKSDNTGKKNVEEGREKKTTDTSIEDYREICKTLSDYMIFLLVHQPEMMPIVAGKTKQRLEHTSKKVEKAYQLASESTEMETAKGKEARREKACKLIREKLTREEDDILYSPVFPFPIEPVMNDLRDLEEKQQIGKWKFMAKVWAELVYYAAIRCKPSVHAAKLKQGGELLSFVWLLLVQLGFGLYETRHSQLQLNQDEAEPDKALLYRCSDYLKDWRRNRHDKSI